MVNGQQLKWQSTFRNGDNYVKQTVVSLYIWGEVEAVLTFIVKDKETGAGIANAYVYLRDGNHQMLMQLGITDSSGSLALSGLTLEPGEYYFDASAAKLFDKGKLQQTCNKTRQRSTQKL